MKRLLDIISGVLVMLVVALGWRVVQVVQVEPPVFGDAPQTVRAEPLPPAPRSPSPRGSEMAAIAEGNLFEVERGQHEEEVTGDAVVEEEPLPPPTNVVLNGVFFQMAGSPMAIMTDTSSGNRQLTLQKGDNLGEYQVGDISRQRVVLLGRGGQEFSLELDIKKGGGAPARAAQGARARPAPARTPPAAAPARSPAAQRVSRTAAQRAEEARKQQAARARQAAAARRAPEEPERPDPTQARLEALRRLREAARAR